MERTGRIVAGWVSALVIAACDMAGGDIEETGRRAIACAEGELVSVSFVPRMKTGRTKTSIDADEDMLGDYVLAIYRGGMLECCHYVEIGNGGNGNGGGSMCVELVKNVGYDIYALGNVGEMDVPIHEEDLIGGCVLEYRDLDDFGGVFPMAWMETGRVFGNDDDGIWVEMRMERLVAKIAFGLDTDAILGGLKVRSVRLRQAAGKVWPFGNNHGDPESGQDSSRSRITDEADAVDGDYAGAEDVEAINGGEMLAFYCLENCQGTLLPENTDEWAKVPLNLGDEGCGDRAGLCTYLEVECSFNEDFALDGDVTYRLFLGEDNTGNFDIARNKELTVSLFATRGGLDAVSWRVEAAGEYREGLAEGGLLAGTHPLSGMYVGEIFRYGVEISQSLADYLGDELEDCYVTSEGGTIEFSNCSLNGGLALSCEGKCIDPVEGERLILVTPRGDIMISEGVNILEPRMVLSTYPRSYSFEPLASSSIPSLVVNGDGEEIYLYLTDSEGYNLDSSEAYGFDPGLFDFSESKTVFAGRMSIPETSASYLYPTLLFDCIEKEEESNPDGPIAKYSVSAENPGTDTNVNRNLGYAVFAVNPFEISVSENNYCLSVTKAVNYDIFPVRITAYGPWTDENTFGAELLYGITNRSAIYLDIISWSQSRKRTNATHTMQSWATQNRAEIMSAGATTTDMIYATDQYFPSIEDYERKHYGSLYNFRYDKSAIPGANEEEHYFPVPAKYSPSLLENYIKSDPAGYLTELSSTQTTYSGTSWWYSHQDHFGLDISAEGLNLVASGRLVFEDKFLEGGGAEADATYPYLYGFNVYSYGMPHSVANNYISTYRNCTPRNLYDMVTMDPLVITLGYDPAEKKYYMTCSNNSGGRKIEIKYRANMNGTVTCHPNGQWYKAVVHDVAGSADWAYDERVQLGASRTYIDGGAVRTLMNKIYAMSYPDNSSNIGSSNKDFQHFCHPTDGVFTMEIRSADNGRLLPYRITVDPSAETLDYYHSQDNQTYHVAMTISYPNYWQFGLIR